MIPVQRIFGGALVLASLLAGCTTQPVATNVPTALPQPTATVLPTAAPPSATPQPAPSATVQPVGHTLPAPLYFINDHHQIVRLETDGTTRTTLTNESEGVAWFRVSPHDGAMVYTTANNAPTTLIYVNAHGGQRSELVKGLVRMAEWSADGHTLAVDLDAGPQGSGVYALTTDGTLTSIVKATPYDAATNTEGLRYSAIAWSPDNSKILLRTGPDFGPDAPAGDLGSAGLAIADRMGAITELVQLGSKPFLCSQAFWSVDSASIYCAQEGYASEAPGLWRIAATGGVPEALVRGTDAGNAMFFRPIQLANGDIYSFADTELPNAGPQHFTMQRRNADGGDATALRSDAFDWRAVLPAAWSSDGSGVVVKDPNGEGDKGLIWVPVDGGATINVPDAFQNFVQWGVQ